MNQNQTNMLATVAAVFTALLLLFFFLFSFGGGRRGAEITLPGDITGSEPPVDVSPPFTPELAPPADTQGLLEITRENAAVIVADLERPRSYSCDSTVTTYASDMSSTTVRRVTVLDDFQKTEYLNGTGVLEMTEVMGTSLTFYWDSTPNAPLKTVPTGNFLKDASARMPTYEDILRLPLSEITAADYVLREDRPCVWIHTAQDGYDIEYYVDLETGLLVSAFAGQSGVQAWTFAMTGVTLNTASAEDFMLPNGLTAMEAQELEAAGAP